MNLSADQVVRDQLISFLKERNAHANLDDVLNDFPLEHIHSKIEGVEYTPWQLLEHMRLCQDDIIEFIENPDYKMPDWPADYWSKEKEADKSQWERCVSQLYDGIGHLERMINNPNVDLYQSMPAGEKYTVFREILVIIDHNAHHLGQLVLFRKHFSAWKK